MCCYSCLFASHHSIRRHLTLDAVQFGPRCLRCQVRTLLHGNKLSWTQPSMKPYFFCSCPEAWTNCRRSYSDSLKNIHFFWWCQITGKLWDGYSLRSRVLVHIMSEFPNTSILVSIFMLIVLFYVPICSCDCLGKHIIIGHILRLGFGQTCHM